MDVGPGPPLKPLHDVLAEGRAGDKRLTPWNAGDLVGTLLMANMREDKFWDRIPFRVLL